MSPREILSAKLFIPPARANLVSRPRLIEQLNRGLSRRMSLISAPAGFGKTTLISKWVADVGAAGASESPNRGQVAWVSLDEGDNDPTRFLTYMIVALSRLGALEGKTEERILGMLRSPQAPPYEDVLTALVNAFAATPGRMVLVLDDYHVVESSAVDDALLFTLEHMPPSVHLALVTRVDPNLPLARLRAQDQLAELRASDLRFTLAESAEFLNQVMGLGLSEKNIEALEARTEGWIAGLQLAALSMQGLEDRGDFIEAFSGSHRFVLDYLVEEVLEKQSESIQRFLIKTAILDRLTGPLCDALVGEAVGTSTLQILERRNLFLLPLDAQRRWYRYHPLFADFLRQRLGQSHPDQVPGLHRLASLWYAENGFIDPAIEHALRGRDYERAAAMIETQFDVMYQGGEHMKLRRWLAALPADLVAANPQLCLLQAWNLFTGGQLAAAAESLASLDEILLTNPDQSAEAHAGQYGPAVADRSRLVGRAATIRAFLASYAGDVSATLESAHRALGNLPETDLFWRSAALIAMGDAHANQGDMQAAYKARWDTVVASEATGDIYLLMLAHLRLAETLRQRGELRQIIDLCERQIGSAREFGRSETVAAGYLLAIWGEVLAEMDQLGKAIDRAEKGVGLTERGRDVAMIGWSNLCLARVLFSMGDLAGLENVLRKVERMARDSEMPAWIPTQMAAWQARTWLAQGRLDAASYWVMERGLKVDGQPTYLHEVEYITLSRVLMRLGRMEESLRLLAALLEGAETAGRKSRVIEILILQALDLQAWGDTNRALDSLGRGLALAEPLGFVRIFLDEGPPMARLLYEAAAREAAGGYAQRLLGAFPVPEPEAAAPSTHKAQESHLVEQLTEREIDVLQHISEGLTNRQIAARLFLSVNTVKAHTRNIYGKLDVNNRTQAISKARALGILPFT